MFCLVEWLASLFVFYNIIHVFSFQFMLSVSHFQKTFFVMPSLQYEKLKYCSNVVDVRMVLCLVELITC